MLRVEYRNSGKHNGWHWSTVVDRTFTDGIPLNGRIFQTLIMLTPGVVVTQTAYDDQGQFSVNGLRADANYFTVDGVSANFGVTGYAPLMQAAGGALPASRSKEEQIAPSPWTRCRNFVFRRLHLRRSLDGSGGANGGLRITLGSSSGSTMVFVADPRLR